VIEINGLSWSVNGRHILRNIDLKVRGGEVLALVGPSGSGKTSLLRILNMLNRDYQGLVLVDKHDIINGDMALRRSMAMVFQKPVVFSMSVYENVAYGLQLRKVPKPEIQSSVKEVLALLDMAGREKDYARHLSGGEAQRIAFARAYVIKPKILFLDEPTANLDRQNVAIIEKAVKDINERYGTTVVIVTHSLPQAKRLADRIAVMIDGELVETGPVHDILEKPSDPRTKAFVSGDMVF
jgi:tungstate transport system ATP-binding protein